MAVVEVYHMEMKENEPEEACPLSDEQNVALEALRAEFTPEELSGISEIVLIRFVRGYWREKERHTETVAKLRKMLEFRAEHKADTLLAADLPKEEEYFRLLPHDYHGVDKRGHPVYIEKTANGDPSELLKTLTIPELMAFHTQMQETLEWIKKNQSEKTGLMTYKSIVIMDLYDFGMKHCGSSFYDILQSVINIDQYYYPETLKKLFLINCPFVFRVMWKVVKPWLHPITASRIEICGGSYLPKLQELIEDENIPRYLGGKCTCCTEAGLETQMDQKLARCRKWREERNALATPQTE